MRKTIKCAHLKFLLPVNLSVVLLMVVTIAQGQGVDGLADDKAPQELIKLQFHVTVKDQALMEGKEALLERVTLANTIYRDTRLRFELGEVLPLPAEIQDLVSREDRNSLAEKVPSPDRVIQIFLVPSARDVDKLDAWIAGVHWRYGGKQKAQAKRRFIILSSMHSDGETLAHELGHWFGLQHHKETSNLMCGLGSRSDTLLNKEQIKVLHTNREAALGRKEIQVRQVPRQDGVVGNHSTKEE